MKTIIENHMETIAIGFLIFLCTSCIVIKLTQLDRRMEFIEKDISLIKSYITYDFQTVEIERKKR